MITLTIILIAIPVILIIALFTRNGINTSASIDINKPQQEVFDYLLQMKNQEHYNAWLMIDPQMKKEYTGTDGEAGFMISWESKNKKDGKASQRIITVSAPDKIEIELVFEKPIPSTARYQFLLSSITDNQTHVDWIYAGNPTPYYLFRVSQLLLRLKKQVNKYMDGSLNNLKEILEKNTGKTY